jgi:acetoacetyl-CoA synthetase
VIEEHFCSGPGPTPSILDCLAVGQTMEGGSDERVILFVKLVEGEMLSPELEHRIKKEIRCRRSPRHVPARVNRFRDVAPECC